MSLLGKTKFQKFSNVIVLLLFIGYGLHQLGIFTPKVSAGYEYSLTATELGLFNQQALDRALADYQTDPQQLSNALAGSGISLEEFEKFVTVEFIAEHNQQGFQGLTIEFHSDINRKKLKPAYDFIINDVRQAIIDHKVSQ